MSGMETCHRESCVGLLKKRCGIVNQRRRSDPLVLQGGLVAFEAAKVVQCGLLSLKYEVIFCSVDFLTQVDQSLL